MNGLWVGASRSLSMHNLAIVSATQRGHQTDPIARLYRWHPRGAPAGPLLSRLCFRRVVVVAGKWRHHSTVVRSTHKWAPPRTGHTHWEAIHSEGWPELKSNVRRRQAKIAMGNCVENRQQTHSATSFICCPLHNPALKAPLCSRRPVHH